MSWRTVLTVVLISVLAASYASAVEDQGVDLSSMEGWDIVVSEDALPSEVYAAEEFQSLFAEASGIRLPIVKTTDRADRHVFIGPSEAMRISAAGFDVGDFGSEDLRIVVRGDNIVIAGGRPRGTLYGVYTFLENYLGVRFLTVNHTHVPKIASSHVVGPVDYFYHPPLTLRSTDYVNISGGPPFGVRLRNNSHASGPRLGGRTTLGMTGHSFGYQIPSAKYGKEHPEYFCEIDGKRVAGPFESDGFTCQPCLTNPDVLRIVTASVLKELADHPEKGIVAVGQNDNNKYCRCAKCSAIDEREGTPMGSILTFVNAVADEVAKKHPGVMVGTLSYWYSQRPPKTIKPRPNVQIQLCSVWACQIHAMNDPTCPKNAAFCRDMDGWAKICDNIFIWNYCNNFGAYQLPCPNLRAIGPNIKYFVGNNAKGIFMQTGTMGGEFSELRSYILSNLLWDPTRDAEQLMEEFLDLHYGRAAAPIRRFVKLVHDRAEASGLHPRCWGRAKDYGLDESVAGAGLEAFTEAMELAENDAVRLRVEKPSIGAYRLALEPIWYLGKPTELDPALAERMRPHLRRFFELCSKYGVVYVKHPPNHTPEVVSRRFKRLFGLEESDEF